MTEFIHMVICEWSCDEHSIPQASLSAFTLWYAPVKKIESPPHRVCNTGKRTREFFSIYTYAGVFCLSASASAYPTRRLCLQYLHTVYRYTVCWFFFTHLWPCSFGEQEDVQRSQRQEGSCRFFLTVRASSCLQSIPRANRKEKSFCSKKGKKQKPKCNLEKELETFSLILSPNHTSCYSAAEPHNHNQTRKELDGSNR